MENNLDHPEESLKAKHLGHQESGRKGAEGGKVAKIKKIEESVEQIFRAVAVLSGTHVRSWVQSSTLKISNKPQIRTF